MLVGACKYNGVFCWYRYIAIAPMIFASGPLIILWCPTPLLLALGTRVSSLALAADMVELAWLTMPTVLIVLIKLDTYRCLPLRGAPMTCTTRSIRWVWWEPVSSALLRRSIGAIRCIMVLSHVDHTPRWILGPACEALSVNTWIHFWPVMLADLSHMTVVEGVVDDPWQPLKLPTRRHPLQVNLL